MSDAPCPISCGAPRFDGPLDAWILSRHVDVTAARLDDRLAVPGASGDRRHAARQARERIARSLDKGRSVEWRDGMASSARRTADRLRSGEPLDLVAEFAAPWSLGIAAMVAGIMPEDARELAGLAGRVFRAMARATSPGFAPDALEATAALTSRLGATDSAAGTQTFVALSQTLPCALAGVWHVLVDHPAGIERLHRDPGLMAPAVDESLRLASPSRVVFRRATVTLETGGAQIEEGDTVILALAAANRDPSRFPDPDRFDPDREGGGHLGFGRGRHGCPGASLVRQAVTVATEALVAAAPYIERAGDVEWTGGFAIGGPATLPVVLHPMSRRDAGDKRV